VCKPTSPLCTTCPLASVCAAHVAAKAGTGPAESSYPAKAAAITKKDADAVACVVTLPASFSSSSATEAAATASAKQGADFVLLLRRPDKGLLGGMWEVPTVDLPAIKSGEAKLSHKDAQAAVLPKLADMFEDEAVSARLRASVQASQPCGHFQHQFSHISLRTHVLRCSCAVTAAEFDAMAQVCQKSQDMKLVRLNDMNGAGVSTLTSNVLQAASRTTLPAFVSKKRKADSVAAAEQHSAD
jgi:adenine-specific DNA glycosylase